MAWLFVGLKLRLMAGALRGNGGRARAIGLILATIGGLYAMPAGFSLLASLPGGSLAADAVVVVFTLTFAGWAVLPLLTFGTDETLDPARLALLPLRRRTMMAGLFAAALTGIGPVVTFVVLLGVTTAFSGLLRSRRGRDLGIVAGALLTFAVIGGNIALQQSLLGGKLGAGVRAVARVVRWTPPGMLAHAIGDAAGGSYLVALLELAAGGLTVCGLLWIWMAVLGRALIRADASTQAGRSRAGAGIAGPASAGQAGPAWAAAPARTAPQTAAAAFRPGRPGRASRALTVTAKELRYSWRDPRRKVGWLGLGMAVVVILSVPFGTAAGGLAGAIGPVLIVAAVYGGTVAGIQSANQFGLDGGALWLNVAATSRAHDLRADLAGKNLASAVVAMPVFALPYAVLGLATHQASYPAFAFGMAACSLGVTLGITSVASVLLPYAVPERRASVFGGAGTGRGCLAALANVAILVLAVVFLTPVFVLLAILHAGLWLLLAGPGYGAAMAWAGRIAASDIGFRRLPELLAEVSRPF